MDGGWPNSHESEGPVNCGLCGCTLWVSLLEYGVESELDHFEENGITGGDDWQCFLDVMEGIEYVEREGYPDKWDMRKPREVEKARRLYARTIALLEKYLPKQEAVDVVH